MRRRMTRVVNRILSPDYRHYPIIGREQLVQRAHAHIQEFGTCESLTFTPPTTPHQQLPPAFTTMIGSTQHFPPPAIYTLHDAHLAGPDALVITAEQAILADSLYNHAPYQQIVNTSQIYQPPSIQALWHQLTHIEQYGRIASAVMLYSSGFFHWMMEQLPRLWLLQQHMEDITVLIPPNPPRWMRDTLALLNITDTVEWLHTRAQVKQLVFPSCIHGTGIPSSNYLRTISTHFKTQLKDRLPTYNTPRIYISRNRDSTRRRIANEDAILPVLSHHGFVTYHLSELSVAEQIALFSQAECIIGPHGAGLVNMMHSNNATVLEIFEPHYINTCYYRMSCGFGFTYGVVIGASHGQDIMLQPKQLEDLLSLVLPDSQP